MVERGGWEGWSDTIGRNRRSFLFSSKPMSASQADAMDERRQGERWEGKPFPNHASITRQSRDNHARKLPDCTDSGAGRCWAKEGEKRGKRGVCRKRCSQGLRMSEKCCIFAVHFGYRAPSEAKRKERGSPSEAKQKERGNPSEAKRSKHGSPSEAKQKEQSDDTRQ